MKQVIFWFQERVGVTVNEFSIGFGPVIFKKQTNKTKYTLRLIPLGGFVNLEGEEERVDKEGSYSNASIPKRMAIIVAGGLVNIVFALVLYFSLMLCMSNHTSLVIDSLVPEYAGELAQIEVNEEIIKINNKKVYTKNDIDKIMNQNKGEELTLTLKKDGNIREVKLVPTKIEYKNTGIYLKSVSSGENTKIISIEANSIAEKNGIKPNDEILKINGIEVKNQTEILEVINKEEQEENSNLNFTIKRGKEVLEISLVPETLEQYYLGIYFAKADNTFTNNIYYSFFETRDFSFSIFENLKMLFTGKVRVNQFMGPVGISEVVANTNKLGDFLNIVALISLSLGVTNLLPIPALDGGKFLLLVIEAIRRKKLSEKAEININLIGFAFLIILSLYIAYNDILRIL